MAYDTALMTISYYDGSSWQTLDSKPIYTNPNNSPPALNGLSLNSLRDTSALLYLSNSPGLVLLPEYTNADLPLIEQPSLGMMIFNFDENKIQVYISSKWISLKSNSLPIRPITPVTLNVEGIAIGTNVKNPASNLHISNSNKGTLSIPTGSIHSVYKPTKGGILFDSNLNDYYIFDGELWRKFVKLP